MADGRQPVNPAWADMLFDELGDDCTTVEVGHKRSEVELAIEVLTEQPPDVWAQWAKSADVPQWMRTAIVEYTVSSSRWQQVSLIAQLDLMAETLDDMGKTDVLEAMPQPATNGAK